MAEKRFSPAAEEVLHLAHEAAREFGGSYVGCEHLLLALLRRGRGAAYRALQEAGASEETVRAALEREAKQRCELQSSLIGLTPQAKSAVEMAAAEMLRSGSPLIGSEHLLLGILRSGENSAVRILGAAGIDTKKLYTALLRRQNEERDGLRNDPSPRGTGLKREKGLGEFTRDLTAAARCGRLDPVIGRETEITRTIQILTRRTKNNPVLIGEPGVGKTAIAEGLAEKIAVGDVPEELMDKRVLSLDISGMVAGTKYRGEFEERVRGMLDEVRRDGSIILFIDELHTIVGAGSAEGAVDAANIVKPALGRGELRVIGATTPDEYRRYIEKDAALERRFQPVTVAEPSAEQTVGILRGLREKYELHHRLRITDDALCAAVELAQRYITDRFLPDKAIDLMDEAASYVRLHGQDASEELCALEKKTAQLRRDRAEALAAQDYALAAQLHGIEENYRAQAEAERTALRGGRQSVTRGDIAAVVAAWTGIPVMRLDSDENDRLLQLEETLRARVIGQEEAIGAVARAIRRSRVGIRDPKRPIGSFLFLGSSGVGKTELCKALAEALFGTEEAMIRLDMTEYSEKYSLSRLIGSPPGYVGHEEGGQLTEKVRRRPYCVVLFDEIEKAHGDIWNLLLQIMEDGAATDAQGRRVDFRSAVIIMTSNLGAKNITADGARLGFVLPSEEEKTEQMREAVMREVRQVFRPEFVNRIDELIVFRTLGERDMLVLAQRLFDRTAARAAELGITLHATDAALGQLAKRGFDPHCGARPLRRLICTEVEDRVAERLLTGELRSGDRVLLEAADGVLCLRDAVSSLSCTPP